MDKETMLRLRAEAAREMMVRVERLVKAIHALERSYPPVYLEGYTGSGAYSIALDFEYLEGVDSKAYFAKFKTAVIGEIQSYIDAIMAAYEKL